MNKLKDWSATILLIILFTGLHDTLMAQEFFMKSYGGNSEEKKARIASAPDGGFLIAATTKSFAVSTDLYLVRVNNEGQKLWTKTIGTPEHEVYGNVPAWSVKTVPEGGFIILGSTGSFYPDWYVVRINNDGDTLWTRTFGDPNLQSGDYGSSILATSDGGFLLAGSIGLSTIGLVKLNSSGDTLWTKFLGSSPNDGWAPSSLTETPNGDFILSGNINSNVGNGFLMRINPAGEVLWSKSYGGPRSDRFLDVKCTQDGSIIAFGHYSYFLNSTDNENFLVLRTDGNGNPLWHKNLNYLKYDKGYSISLLNDGFAFSGISSPSSGFYPVVFKTDFSGNLQFSNVYNEPNSAWGGNLLHAQDGSFFLSGDNMDNMQNCTITRTDSLGFNCRASFASINDTLIPLESQVINTVNFPRTLVRKNSVTTVSSGGTENSVCSNTGIEMQIEAANASGIFPNPCSDCFLKTGDDAGFWICSDIFGRRIPLTFSQSSNGYQLNFEKGFAPQVLFLKNSLTGKHLRFNKF